MEVRRALVSLLPLALASLVLGGCTVGEYGAPGSDSTGKSDGTGPDAGSTGETNADKVAFTVNVKPTVSEAACTGCHGATAPTFDSFEMLQDKYKTKATAGILLTKGPHQGSPYFTDPQKAKIQIYVDGLK